MGNIYTYISAESSGLVTRFDTGNVIFALVERWKVSEVRLLGPIDGAVSEDLSWGCLCSGDRFDHGMRHRMF